MPSLLIRHTLLLPAALIFFTLTESLSAQKMSDPVVLGSEPEVRLEVHESKSQFFIGERVELDLVFRNTTSDQYLLNNTLYGDIADAVEIAPASGLVQWRGRSGHDYSSVTNLGSKEFRIPIVLNEGFVFREPGHYEIRVTTNRLSRGGNLVHIKPLGPIATNAVAIDMQKMPAETETKLIEQARNAIGPADTQMHRGDRERGQAMAKLADLQGDEALRAKLDLILAGDEQMRTYSAEAMASTRNLQLQLELLEGAWRNPQQMPLYDMPGLLAETRSLLQGKSLPGWRMFISVPNANDPEIKRSTDERTADMKALLETLPQRSGANRAAALYYLLDFPGLSDADTDKVRPIVAAEFLTLNSLEQDMLLATAWNRLRGPAMVAPLKALLQQAPQDKDAVRRLIELDPQAAKSYVIQTICGRGWPVPLDSVAALPFDTLPEVDDCLGEMLSTPPAKPHDNPWRMRAALAARFATAAILPQVRAGWKYPEQDSDVLPLLLRLSPDEAMAKITASPFDDNRLMNLFFNIDKSFISRQAAFPPQLSDWLRQMLQDGPNNQAAFAAYQLSKGGVQQDRALLEARLARLRKEWTGRSAGIEAAFGPEGSRAAQDSSKLEIELVSALISKRFWSLSDEELGVLTQGCLSAQCRNYYHPGKPLPTAVK
jgi:hypothetical protein